MKKNSSSTKVFLILSALKTVVLLLGNSSVGHTVDGLTATPNERAPCAPPSASSRPDDDDDDSLVDALWRWQRRTTTSPGRERPLTRTILFAPPEWHADDVVYAQKATNARVEGFERLRDACRSFDDCFQTTTTTTTTTTGSVDFRDDVASSVSLIAASTSPNEVLVDWDVTWFDPSVLWLKRLGDALPNVDVVPTPYAQNSDRISTVSWRAIGRLFADALATGTLRVPAARVEGTSTLRFATTTTTPRTIVRVEEELSFAQDLRRGALRNRRCAEDLRLFLESGRRVPRTDDDDDDDWDDVVAASLPWSSVPGSNPLDLDPTEEDSAAFVFLGVVCVSLLAFASFAAPELVGQSLFGPPTYVVPPNDPYSAF